MQPHGFQGPDIPKVTKDSVSEIHQDLADEFEHEILAEFNQVLPNLHQKIKAICASHPEAATDALYEEAFANIEHFKGTNRKRVIALLQDIVDDFESRLAGSLRLAAGDPFTEEANKFSSHVLARFQPESTCTGVLYLNQLFTRPSGDSRQPLCQSRSENLLQKMGPRPSEGTGSGDIGPSGKQIEAMKRWLDKNLTVVGNLPKEIVKVTASAAEFRKQRKTRLAASQIPRYLKLLSSEEEEIKDAIAKFIELRESTQPLVQVKSPSKEYARQYDITNEPVAIRKYKEKTKNEVDTTGLWVNGRHPWIWGVPDGVFSDTRTGETGILEVKCPATAQNSAVEDYISSCPYLRTTPSGLALNPEYGYYSQIQLYMKILGHSCCHFVVLIGKEIIIVRVEIDHAFLHQLLPQLQEVYGRFMLSNLALLPQVKYREQITLLSRSQYQPVRELLDHISTTD